MVLNDYLRLMWTTYGAPGAKAAPGVVAKPYGMEDLQGRLAQLSGDAAFAREFFAKYIQGHDVPDYGRVLGRMGLLMRKKAAGKAWLGSATMQYANGGLRVGLVPFDSPLYKAGLAQDDQIVAIAGVEVISVQVVQAVLARHKPGEKLALRFVRRSGETVNGGVVLEEDPRIEIVAAETTGATVTPEQRRLRAGWLASRRMK